MIRTIRTIRTIRCVGSPVVVACLVIAGALSGACRSAPVVDVEPVAAHWPVDCPPMRRALPLSLEAARDAHRWAEIRRAKRLREAAVPGTFLREAHTLVDAATLSTGGICLATVADLGRMIFEHEYGFADGLGAGGSAKSPNGPFRRVHGGAFGGPETISCTSCHWVGGPNGAGSELDNAFLNGDGESVESGDARNPQALMGLGVVVALAREMTVELQQVGSDLLREGSGEVRLISKGVDFGVLRLTDDGSLDLAEVRGVDADLVVKPFGWKGNFIDIADFAIDALQVHMGVQSDALLRIASADAVGGGDDPQDPDSDGVMAELADGPLSAMIVHLALLEMPIVEPLIQREELGPAASGLLGPTTTSFLDDFQRGRKSFHELGCAECHRPMLVLKSPILELEGLPSIDLAASMRQPGLRYEPSLDGYPVWLFSDLKRHDMGPANRALHEQRGVGKDHYMTPRLWGVADSAPYLHDGRAPSFDYAIAGHDGEAAAARDAFAGLSMHEKGALRVYLMSMRRQPRLMIP